MVMSSYYIIGITHVFAKPLIEHTPKATLKSILQPKTTLKLVFTRSIGSLVSIK